MRNIWSIFRRDVSRVSGSVIGLIVAVGLVIIPCLYAWFNIAGSWDPYGNTGNLKVAVANADAGYNSDLIPVKVNLGEQVVSALRENDQLDWVFVDEDEATEGVKSGEYYAAVVIPSEFSADMMTLFSADVTHAQIVYYENQKANAIAPRVTDTGASTVQQQIDETFAKTLADVGLAATSSLLDYMSSDQVANYVTHLSASLSQGITTLRDVSGTTASLANVLGSTSGTISSTSGLLEGNGDTSQQAQSLLADAQGGIANVKEALTGATDAVNKAIKDSSSSLSDVSSAIDKAFSAGTTQATDTAKQLDDVAAKLEKQANANQATLDRLNDTSMFPPVAGVDVLSPLKTMLKTVIQKENALASQLSSAATKLRDGVADANGDLTQVKNLVQQAKDGITDAKGDYETTLTQQASQLKGTISDVVSSADSITGSLTDTVQTLSEASDSLAKNLDEANAALVKTSGDIDVAANDIEQMADDLSSALSSGDLASVKQIIGSDPEGLASALTAPVSLDKKPVYHVENYGSAMAPFYTAVSLWVGGIVLAAMMKVAVDDDFLATLVPFRLHEIYLGRFCLFALFSLLQSSLMLAGELLFFGIQCQDPLLYLLAGWVGGLMFCMFIYTLTVSFGDIGKALAVVLLVMQVGGSGGTFPIEMTSPFFQAVYPFLPAAHLINAMHAAMAGGYGLEYWIELGIVSLYFIPVLALGVVFRRPVIRANNWIIEKLEETHLM